MIIYNTLVGVLTGIVTITAASLLRAVHADGRMPTIGDRRPVTLPRTYESHALVLTAAGLPLLVLGVLMATTWPLFVNPPINIAFGEPATLLAIVALATAVLAFNGFMPGRELPVPYRVVLASTGGVLTAIASAVFSYDLVGDAPVQEPITGQFQGWENTTFVIVYAVAALACLGLSVYRPGGSSTLNTTVYHVTRWSLLGSGLFFLLFSILNYRTHIGLLINLEQGTDYRW